MDQTILEKIHKHFEDSEAIAYPKGAIIIQASEEPTGISLLIDGLVEQYDITPEGNKITVNIFKPSAFFPMSWAINKMPNAYFYSALTDVKIQRADANTTVVFLKANPDVLFDLLSRVYKGTDALLRRLVLSANGVASRRLIFELLIEAYRFGTEIEDKKVLIHLKRHVLAAHSGLARETVSRELHKLEKEKLLLLTKVGIELDITALEKKLHSQI
jgi:CRP/FNR family transcriptional regulator, cyclic AMP receptor protein